MTPKPKRQKPSLDVPMRDPHGFAEIVALISTSQQNAYRAVNTALIDLYWQVGEYISRKIEAAEWGTGTVENLAQFIAHSQPGLRGFSRPNLFRMKQFYEAYRDGAIVWALLRQLPWTHHLIIMSKSKRPEEREFSMRMAIRERWSSLELERQFKAALFECAVLAPPKVAPLVRQLAPEALTIFKDAYMLEFLDLPAAHAEADLHRGLLGKLRELDDTQNLRRRTEPSPEGATYPSPGRSPGLRIDKRRSPEGAIYRAATNRWPCRGSAVYQARSLRVLPLMQSAMQTSVTRFSPSPFPVMVLSRRGSNFCYARSSFVPTRTPALIAEYQTQLPDKKLLQAKLHKFYLQNAPEGDLV
jgi:predicted nuclease of restriction endonuclease-like (RecB) superfamily